MMRRSALVALALAACSTLSTGCLCGRPPLLSRFGCLGCGPALGAPIAPPAPVVGFAPAPMAVPFTGPVGEPGCVNCGLNGGLNGGPPGGHPVNSLPTGAIPIGPGTPVGAAPIFGGDPYSKLPPGAMPGSYPAPGTVNAPPTPLLPAAGGSTQLGMPSTVPPTR